MSYGRQKKNTTKLPKVLRDELVSLGRLSTKRPVTSLGKLDPQRSAKKRPHEHRGGSRDAVNKKPYHKSRSTVPSGAYTAGPSQGSRKYVKRQAQEEDVSSAEEEDESLNDEDRMIAELEKKLGMDKRKASKLGDDELDGSTQHGTISNYRSTGWNRSVKTRY